MAKPKPGVTLAVNYLIESPNYPRLIKELRRVMANWHNESVIYNGELAVLNPLVDAGLENIAGFERLVQLIEQRRRMIPEAKRTEYQAKLMRERRTRIYKALELQALIRGRALRGGERQKFIADLQSRWNAAKATYLEQKGELSWKERNAATNEFWAEIDANLEVNLAAERAKKAH